MIKKYSIVRLKDIPHNAKDGYKGLTLLGLLHVAVQCKFRTLEQLICKEIGNRGDFYTKEIKALRAT